MQWILGIGITILVFYVLKWWSSLSEAERKGSVWKLAVGALVVVLLVLVLTGRIHILTAAIAALLPLLRKLPSLLRFVPRAGRQRERPNDDDRMGGAGGYRGPSGSSTTMSVKEACDILGVRKECSADEIIAAHRRLMQKLHPDRGGNDYLAAKVNEAKSVLLARRSG